MLTLSELRVANNLNNMNPFPYDVMGLVQLHQQHSPMLVQGIPMGWNPILMNPNLRTWEMIGIKPNVATGHVVLPHLQVKAPHGQRLPQKCKGRSSGERTLPHGGRPCKDAQKEDSNWEDDPRGMAESQFEDTNAVNEVGMDTAEDCTMGALPSEDTAEALLSENIVETPPLENIIEVSVGPGSEDVVRIHAGNDDDME